MNVLFLTLSEIDSIEQRGIYQDLLRRFRDEGHNVTIVSPIERRRKKSTSFIQKDGVSILKVKTFNIQKTNVIEKGIGTLAIEYQFLFAIKHYLSHKKIDLILYSTPPITFAKVVEFIKKKHGAYSYLLLKDIFPQNAVDMKMIKEGGFVHKQFLKKEKRLYEISDTIGCMSPANVDFLLKYNSEIDVRKVEVNPNTIEPLTFNYSVEEKNTIRQKYNVPVGKKILVYGGNLGKPQGLDFLLETISVTKYDNVFFLIVGDGTEYPKVKSWFEMQRPNNAKLLQRLPKEDYDRLLAACDIGLVFLDKNFLIPNFPSRLLSYLEMKMPILAATDPNTDIGTIVEENRCGYKVLAGNQSDMQEKLKRLLNDDLNVLAENSQKLLYENYTVNRSYELIINKFK
ncbi:glycosyltransferase WbuB [Elizabethkingia anophelis]|uniref:glycosyltransferase family 4 protein n=1 Tax=Elizabethkingia anophelis TaxID=1117645 RepID=UPI00293CF47C|nr:glycosyltransferase WbuB [Elizabethkingia anophelis]MDV3600534.1 glycosyltransferase WbuB [Elizabethkingia anophelis]MDV3608352.1 glycosyltransferase WbuB [Elizabethkingia anophelis]MDV3637238.1 glycosyltransferase WbuB [Elizabethkingia anophelis]MDV3650785.1 glycosyltransferase WbuB [Elizabethkingia anophelis]